MKKEDADIGFKFCGFLSFNFDLLTANLYFIHNVTENHAGYRFHVEIPVYYQSGKLHFCFS